MWWSKKTKEYKQDDEEQNQAKQEYENYLNTEKILKENYKMFLSITDLELKDAGVIKFDNCLDHLYSFHMDRKTLLCNKCGMSIHIDMTKPMTREEFLCIIKDNKCESCEEVLSKLEEAYNNVIAKEKEIMTIMPLGTRVKIQYPDEKAYGTIVQYLEEKTQFNPLLHIKFATYGAYIDTKRSFNKAVVMLDRGLKERTVDLNNLEKYDNRLTESEINYITSILERHSIENYADASLILMNRNIISKLTEEK